MTTTDAPAWAALDTNTGGHHAACRHDVDAWHDGYTAGHAAALDARPHATVYQPTTRRWRHVQPGDVFVGKGGALWQVAALTPGRGTVHVDARCGERQAVVDVDPDATIDVLVQRPERDALDLLATQLGATIAAPTAEGRTTG